MNATANNSIPQQSRRTNILRARSSESHCRDVMDIITPQLAKRSGRKPRPTLAE